jgi:hypothetical protein
VPWSMARIKGEQVFPLRASSPQVEATVALRAPEDIFRNPAPAPDKEDP